MLKEENIRNHKVKEVMKMMHTGLQTKHNNNNKDVVVAGIAGLLAGAAGITALALADKDIRKKVGKRAKDLRSNLQDWSAEKLRMVDHQAVHTVEKKEKVTEEVKEDEPLKEVAMKN